MIIRDSMEVLERNFDPEIVRKNFAHVAGIYDLWGWLTESKSAAKVIEMCCFTNRGKILEVAVGTGKLIEKLVSLNPTGTNIGIDLSPDMLAKAEKRMNKQKNGNYKLLHGNALELEFWDESFDLLVNNFMIDLMPAEQFDKIISEFYRVLKKDGIAVISTFSFGYKRIHRFWYWMAKNFPDLLTGCRPVSLKKNLEKAGFIIEQVEQVSQNTFPSEIVKARK